MRWRPARQFVEQLLEQELETGSLSPADRGLLQELVCGVVRWQAALDWLICQKTRGRQQKHVLQWLLRLGLYQVFWLDRIPDHAVVHETVELAKRMGCGPQAGFVNALLRTCLRERDSLRRALQDLKVAQPSLGYSHPAWLCERWEKHWNATQLRQLLDWNNTPPRIWVRVNSLRTRLEGLLDLWDQESVVHIPQQFKWAGDLAIFQVNPPRPIGRLTSFKRGCFYVQDPSTLLAPCVLNPQPGEAVLDFCAAPGGKTTLMAQMMQNRGRIVAQDPDPERLDLVRENCQRLGVTCVDLVAEAPAGVGAQSACFDRVLVDAPCSNTGVMRRRVDLRWRIRPEEIKRLHAAQLRLLCDAAARVRAGGVLVYSTCSLEQEENDQVVKAFLEKNPGFRLHYDRNLLPFADEVDGAYVARLTRESTAQ